MSRTDSKTEKNGVPDLLHQRYDVAIIGSGAGGGTLAHGLARLGRKVLLIEQGTHLPQEADNSSDAGVFGAKYMTRERMEVSGSMIRYPQYAFVGGQTKLYGAALYRLRQEDFSQLNFPDGVSPAWPIAYDDLEPYYCQAEELYKVHGSDVEDPTEPPHSRPYPFKAVAHEGAVQPLLRKLQKQGFSASSIPKAIDLGNGGNCTFCSTCDAYACPTHGKMDTEVACIVPALATGNLTLLTHAKCHRLLTNDGGDRITGMELEYQDKIRTVDADFYVSACGVFHSPALLLRSANKSHPDGLANSSGQVGRNLAGHNAAMFFLPGFRLLPEIHQKTFAMNDFYLGDAKYPYPMGILQAAGRMPIWQHTEKWLRPFAKIVTQRSLLCFLMSEVWPHPDNRVSLAKDGTIQISFKPNNIKGFRELRSRFMKIFRRAGYWGALCSRHVGSGIPWHPVGTLRFGTDPGKSVLDTWCKTHDIDNLYVVDSCFLPTAGAVNTSLTVMAQALRVAGHIHKRLG